MTDDERLLQRLYLISKLDEYLEFKGEKMMQHLREIIVRHLDGFRADTHAYVHGLLRELQDKS